jgi:hypothetical protein
MVQIKFVSAGSRNQQAGSLRSPEHEWTANYNADAAQRRGYRFFLISRHGGQALVS